MRARKVITRSGRGIRGKFPSRKLQKQVHWETPLERDAALLFELHPLIASYQEQPSEECYYDENGQVRVCYPDFLLRLADGSEAWIEVKRKVDLSRSKIKRKLELIALRFAEQGRTYRILSEDQIHREPLHTNLEVLWKATKAVRIDTSVHSVVNALSNYQIYTTEQLSILLGGEQMVLALIARGHLRTDLELQLTPATKVWTALNKEAGDGAFFL
jgi:TnsA endonuclease N terminal